MFYSPVKIIIKFIERVDETMRMRFIMIVILVLMIFIGCSEEKTEMSSEKGSSEWVEFWRFDDGLIISYDNNRVVHMTENIVTVWTKWDYSDESRDEYIQNRKKVGQSTKGYDKLSHTLNLEEINCNEGRYRVLSKTHHDTDGNLLGSRLFDKPDWNDIFPDTMMDALREKVCKYPVNL